MYKLNLIVNCYNCAIPSTDPLRMEMVWVKQIELPFLPFLGLEIIEDGKFIVELKEFDEDGNENTLTYDIKIKEFSYWVDEEKFNILQDEFIDKDKLIERLLSRGYRLKERVINL